MLKFLNYFLKFEKARGDYEIRNQVFRLQV